MVLKNILIIGIGNIGQRHLDSIINNEKIGKIYLYDKSKLILNKLRKKTKNNNKIVILENILNKKKNKFFLCIVSTNSTNRYQLINKLQKKFRIKNWLVEKVFLNSIKDISLFKKKINLRNMYVNLPLRISSPFKILKKKIHDSVFECYLKGGNWNMASNSIHYIDLIKWISNTKVKDISIRKVYNKFNSKRKGFKEFNGQIFINFNNKTMLDLVCDNSLSKKIIFKLKKKIYSYDFRKEILFDGKKYKKIKCEFQSVLTNHIFNMLFKKTKLDLPLVKDHLEENYLFLDAILKKKIFNQSNIPIT